MTKYDGMDEMVICWTNDCIIFSQLPMDPNMAFMSCYLVHFALESFLTFNCFHIFKQVKIF